MGDCKGVQSQSNLKMMKPWCKGFGIDVEVILFLTDDEYLAFHKELD